MLVKEEDFVARGNHRYVYRFPNDEQLLIKLVEHDGGPELQTGFRGYLKRYLPHARYRHLFCEIEHESRIQLRAMLKGIRSPIAPIRGVTVSNKVLGLLVKQVSQKNGNVGLTFDELLEQGKFDEKALGALNEFAQSFFALGVIAGDVNTRNIVWGDFNNELVPFLVDGYGDRNFIPIKTYVPFFKYRKLHKCFDFMAGKIGCRWLRSKRVFVLNSK